MRSVPKTKPWQTTKRSAAPPIVAAGEDYEVSYFATKHNITREQARNFIARIGNDRT